MDFIEMEDCSIGLKLNEECHIQPYVKAKSIKPSVLHSLLIT